MIDLRTSKFREKTATLSHVLIGLAILAKGADKLDHWTHAPVRVSAIFAVGLFVLAGGIFHRPLGKKIRNFTSLFHIAEGLALGFAGWIFLETKGSKIPYFLFFLGVVYIAIGLALFTTGDAEKEKMAKRLSVILGIILIAAAGVTVAVDVVFFRDPWMFVTAGVMAVVGAFLLIIRPRLKSGRSALDA
jgi:hypothetical protein